MIIKDWIILGIGVHSKDIPKQFSDHWFYFRGNGTSLQLQLQFANDDSAQVIRKRNNKMLLKWSVVLCGLDPNIITSAKSPGQSPNMNNSWLVCKIYARFNKRWGLISVLLCATARTRCIMKYLLCNWKTDVTACSNQQRLHDSSPLLKDAQHFEQRLFIFNSSNRQLVVIYPERRIDFKPPEGIKPLNIDVFALPEEQQIKNEVGLRKKIALNCHERWLFPPTHTLRLSVKHEPKVKHAGPSACNPIINSAMHKLQWTVGR